jgi:hypothetical protein
MSGGNGKITAETKTETKTEKQVQKNANRHKIHSESRIKNQRSR